MEGQRQEIAGAGLREGAEEKVEFVGLNVQLQTADKRKMAAALHVRLEENILLGRKGKELATSAGKILKVDEMVGAYLLGLVPYTVAQKAALVAAYAAELATDEKVVKKGTLKMKVEAVRGYLDMDSTDFIAVVDALAGMDGPFNVIETEQAGYGVLPLATRHEVAAILLAAIREHVEEYGIELMPVLVKHFKEIDWQVEGRCTLVALLEKMKADGKLPEAFVNRVVASVIEQGYLTTQLGASFKTLAAQQAYATVFAAPRTIDAEFDGGVKGYSLQKVGYWNAEFRGVVATNLALFDPAINEWIKVRPGLSVPYIARNAVHACQNIVFVELDPATMQPVPAAAPAPAPAVPLQAPGFGSFLHHPAGALVQPPQQQQQGADEVAKEASFSGV